MPEKQGLLHLGKQKADSLFQGFPSAERTPLLARKAFRILFSEVITRENTETAERMSLDSQGSVFPFMKIIVITWSFVCLQRFF